MIRVKALSKTFKLDKKQRKELRSKAREVYAVQDVSFDCLPGRVTALLGPNGAGKTTLLRILATIFKASSGSAEIAGLDIQQSPRAVRRKLGFLTGSTGLYERLSPWELLRYFARLNEIPKTEFKQQAEKLCALLGINEFRNKQIGKLSVGMKQKVSIARTLIHDPEVLIFDEPTSGLDVITAENIIQLIRDCQAQQKTVLFSSHIMSEVDLLADDLLIMHQGRLCYEGSMADFREQSTGSSLTEAFIQLIKQAETTPA